MSYISLERGKDELSVNPKMVGPTGVYPSKTQPNICAKTFASHVIQVRCNQSISLVYITHPWATNHLPFNIRQC